MLQSELLINSAVKQINNPTKLKRWAMAWQILHFTTHEQVTNCRHWINYKYSLFWLYAYVLWTLETKWKNRIACHSYCNTNVILFRYTDQTITSCSWHEYNNINIKKMQVIWHIIPFLSTSNQCIFFCLTNSLMRKSQNSGHK